MIPGLAEYIRKAVDAAPPLSPEQRDRLAVLLRGERPRALLPTRDVSALAEQERRERLAVAQRDAEALSRAILACDGCGLPPAAHNPADPVFSHEWVPGRAVKVTRGE